MQARGMEGRVCRSFANGVAVEGNINGRQRPSCRYERQSSIFKPWEGGRMQPRQYQSRATPFLVYVSRQVLGPRAGYVKNSSIVIADVVGFTPFFMRVDQQKSSTTKIQTPSHPTAVSADAVPPTTLPVISPHTKLPQPPCAPPCAVKEKRSAPDLPGT